LLIVRGKWRLIDITIVNYPPKNPPPNTHTHTHTHVWFTIFVGTPHRRDGFYTVQTVYFIPLH